MIVLACTDRKRFRSFGETEGEIQQRDRSDQRGERKRKRADVSHDSDESLGDIFEDTDMEIDETDISDEDQSCQTKKSKGSGGR